MLKNALLLLTLLFGYTSLEAQVISGCTDPEAVNFNPDATVDDGSCEYECQNNLLTIHGMFAGNSSLSNLSWSIANYSDSTFYDEVVAGADLESTELCLPDGCYTLTLDLSEDGSNSYFLGCMTLEGEHLLFIDTNDDEVTYIDFAVNSECELEGCTDPDALNYNYLANVDDGSCEYPEPCDYNQRRLTFDYVGPPLLSPIHWQITTEGDTLLEGFYFGWLDPVQLCIPDGCYTLSLSGLTEEVIGVDYEISSMGGGAVFLEGQITSTDPVFGNFAVNSDDCPIEGCTDPEAQNYDPDANIDDGSCICNETVFLFFPNQGDTVQWQLTQGDSIIYDGFSINSVITTLCLPFGCYEIQITDPPGGGDGGIGFIYPPGVPFIGIEFEDDEVTAINIPVNADCTEGCTDQEAINYNPEATVDDGSCIYEPECSITFDLLADSANLNTIFVIPDDSIEQAVSLLWDFGDGTTSTDLFPFHEYEGDGPYDLCLTVYFEVGESDTCDVTFCMEISADMIPDLIPGTDGSSGFFINIIDDADTIGIAEEKFISDFNLYPNPVSNELKIAFNSLENSDVILSVHDLSGKLLKKQLVKSNSGENSVTMDFSQLSSGTYLITLQSDHKTIHKKAVKE